MSSPSAQATAPWLWFLLGLFGARVLVQLAIVDHGALWLPEYAYWHSPTLSYNALLITQIVLVGLMTQVCVSFSRGTVRPRRRFGQWLAAFAWVYLTASLMRVALGLTVMAQDPWFGKTLPVVFHVALALFALLVGRFHAHVGAD